MSEEESYNDWTVVDLKSEANTRGLTVPSGANKADIVQLLEDNDDEVEDDQYDEEDEEDEDESPTVGIHPFGTCVPFSPCPHTSDETEEEEVDA